MIRTDRGRLRVLVPIAAVLALGCAACTSITPGVVSRACRHHSGIPDIWDRMPYARYSYFSVSVDRHTSVAVACNHEPSGDQVGRLVTGLRQSRVGMP